MYRKGTIICLVKEIGHFLSKQLKSADFYEKSYLINPRVPKRKYIWLCFGYMPLKILVTLHIT